MLLSRHHMHTIARKLSSLATTPNPIPATFLRGGTSKGIFLNRRNLPEDRREWARIFLGIMGSPDPEYGRQLNGMGGGVSSLSKICVVSEPSDAQRAGGIDAEYTFCQVEIRDSVLDYSGNCGNLSSMIGVFAADEGICKPQPSPISSELGVVRSFNTNTNKRIDTTFPISLEIGNAAILELPQVAVAGVPGKASRIDLDFISPAGARTGKLLPTSNKKDTLTFVHDGESRSVVASLVDATNPMVFIHSNDLAKALHISDPTQIVYTATNTEVCVEKIRQSGAGLMGLDPFVKSQPKIAVLSSPTESTHIVAHAYSMGVLHKAIPMTLGLCLGVAARTEGTLAWQIAQESEDRGVFIGGDLVRIKHPSGIVDVGAEFAENGEVKSAKVVRTGRRLMKGVVWW